MEGALRREARGGRETVALWRGVEAYERMSPFTKVSGPRWSVKTAFPVGNDEDVAGVRNQ